MSSVLKLVDFIAISVAAILFLQVDPSNAPHVSLVISPLRALMKDQVDRCRTMGVNAAMITKLDDMSREDIDKIDNGEISVLFTSPEAAMNGRWLTAIKRYRERISLLVIDEVHCISEWGYDFRPEFRECATLRSCFGSIPCLCISATVTEKILTDVVNNLGLCIDNLVIIAEPPDRPNIFLEVVHQKSYDLERDLSWLVKDVELQKTDCPKTVIYAQSIHQVSEIFLFFMGKLKQKAFTNESNDPYEKMVSMFHGQIGEDLQVFTLNEFKSQSSVIRILICTVAFGMGVEIADIKRVIHWGKSKSMLTFWQEIGRCGRDGAPSKALWYPKSCAGDDREIFQKLKNDKKSCIRLAILEFFVIRGMDTTLLTSLNARRPCAEKCLNCTCELCVCCSHCKSNCCCTQ